MALKWAQEFLSSLPLPLHPALDFFTRVEWDHSHSKVLCKEQSSFLAQAAVIFLISLLKTPDTKANKVTATAQSTASSSPHHPRSGDRKVVLTFHSKAFSNMVAPPVSPLFHLSGSERNQAFYSKYALLHVPSIPSAAAGQPARALPTSAPSPALSLCSYSSGSPNSAWGQSSQLAITCYPGKVGFSCSDPWRTIPF